MMTAGCEEREAVKVAERPGGKFIVVTTAETPPYSYRDPQTGEVIGIEVDIVREAAAKLGREVEYKILKFEYLLMAVKSGEADLAVSGISITEPRKRDVDFSVPYAYDGGRFLYRAGEAVPTMVLAETMRVGVLEATTYDFYLCAHGIDPVRFWSYNEMLKALYENRIDAAFNDGVVMVSAAQESNGVLAVTNFETRENFGIAVRKELPELRDALDEVILARHEDGR